MAASRGCIWLIFIPSLLQLVGFSQATEPPVMCYDCTSWNPYCANSVEIPFPEAVAVVECNITKTCFIRKEIDGMISRGCADWWMFTSVTSDYLGCQEQVPLWMKPQEWCFCDTQYCNGKSMDDIKLLNGQTHDLQIQDTRSQDPASEEDHSSDTEKIKVAEQAAPPSPEQTTILPWWWWHVHWSTEKPHWLEEEDKEQKSNSHNDNHPDNHHEHHHNKDSNEQVVSSEEALGPKVNLHAKVTKHSDWWNVPAVPTGPVGVQGDKQKDTDQQDLNDEEDEITDIKQNDHFEEDFFCWDCYSDNPLCGEIVKTPVIYYVGRVACPITQKCFIRKDKGVIYRGCADGWQDSTIDYLYVGCKNQTIWDRDVEWCFCSSPYCNDQSMDSLRNNHPIIFNAANKQGQGTHEKVGDK